MPSLLRRFYLFIFRDRGREAGRGGEESQCVVASYMPTSGDLTHNPGMCPDWESNQQPFGSQAGTPLTHNPGMCPDWESNQQPFGSQAGTPMSHTSQGKNAPFSLQNILL